MMHKIGIRSLFISAFGNRVAQKKKNCQGRNECQIGREVLMPALQPASLWQETGVGGILVGDVQING